VVPRLGYSGNATYWPFGPWYDGEMSGDFSGRWMQAQLTIDGSFEILGMDVRQNPAGAI